MTLNEETAAEYNAMSPGRTKSVDQFSDDMIAQNNVLDRRLADIEAKLQHLESVYK